MATTTYTIISSDQQQQNQADHQQNQHQNHELITATTATGEQVTIQLANFVSLQQCQMLEQGATTSSAGQIVFQGSDLTKLGNAQQQQILKGATILGYTQDDSGRLVLEMSEDSHQALLASNPNFEAIEVRFAEDSQSQQSQPSICFTTTSTLTTPSSSSNQSHHQNLEVFNVALAGNNSHSQQASSQSFTTSNTIPTFTTIQSVQQQQIPNIISKRTTLASSSNNNHQNSRVNQSELNNIASQPSPPTPISSSSDQSLAKDTRDITSPGILLKATPTPKLPSLKCSKCPKVYTGKTANRDLTRHFRDHHLCERHRCPHCSCSFLRPDNLTEHLRGHRAKRRAEEALCTELGFAVRDPSDTSSPSSAKSAHYEVANNGSKSGGSFSRNATNGTTRAYKSTSFVVVDQQHLSEELFYDAVEVDHSNGGNGAREDGVQEGQITVEEVEEV